ncbi:MAG: flagellar biosynthesis anti-sigma factor FlgM [Acidobacteriota bacterium]
MKINGNDPVVRVQFQVDQTEPDRSAKTGQKTEPKDRLEFSTTSRELQSTRAKETSVPRAERIAQIQKQLEDGTYNIKAEKVAEAIMKGAIVDELA